MKTFRQYILEASADDFPFTQKEMIDLGKKFGVSLRKGEPTIGKKEVRYTYDNGLTATFDTHESSQITLMIKDEKIDVPYKGGKISIRDIEKAFKQLTE